MKFKTKIMLGYLTILLVLLVMGIYSIINLNSLDSAATNILKDNLFTVQLSQRMVLELDKMQVTRQQLIPSETMPPVFEKAIRESVHAFEVNLRKEQDNITEAGERALTASMADVFEEYQDLLLQQRMSPGDYGTELLPRYQLIRDQLDQLMSMNIEAMAKKSDQEQRIAQQTKFYTFTFLAVALLLGLGFLLTVPAALSKPTRHLVDSIQAAARKDFTQRLPTRGKDEFGKIAKVYNSMLKKLSEYEFSNLNELLTEKRRIELILQSLDEGILLLDQNLKITEANPTACRILGVGREDLVGKQSQVVENENALYREIVKDIMIGTTSGDHLVTVREAKEEAFYRKSIVEIVSYNELLERSELSGYVISLRNVSDFKRLDQAKSGFLATVSHELKTPLAAIGYSLKLLQDERVGRVNPEQRDILATVKQETGRLQRIVGQLMDVSRLESGNIQLNIQQANLADIIRFAEQVIGLQMVPKGLRLEVRIENELTDVLVDAEKTAWVLINLLSNAVRYSPENDVITLSTQDREHEVLVRIHDNGPGIDPADHQMIFEKFVQIAGKTQYKGSSGLGLSISQEFVRSQGGRIWVESELGTGSTFVLSLPLYMPFRAE
ncbi:sensor histidine kinase [Pontibacter liquoris]|uniref:sensor histidine kinase n=1 Tax=Pontibacter liquoris TaxID=2905677 RepID=UPI001FA77043|nr:ATP-binding protein [Pontibacter liquoris]